MSEKILKQVLVVDDEIPYLTNFQRRFKATQNREDCPYRFEVETATSGSEGIEKIRAKARQNNQFDVILLDQKMETEKAGLSLAIHLGIAKEIKEPLPLIIIFTGYPTYQDSVLAMRRGAWDYITKEDVGNRSAVQIAVDSAIEGLRESDLRRDLEERITKDWYPRHRPELCEKYGGRLLALYGKEVIEIVAEGKDFFDLQEKVANWKIARQRWEHPYILKIPRN